MSFTRLAVHGQRVRMANSMLCGFYHNFKNHRSRYVSSLHGKMSRGDPGVRLHGCPVEERGVGWSRGDRRQAIGSMLPVPKTWRVRNPLGVPTAPHMPHGVHQPAGRGRLLTQSRGGGRMASLYLSTPGPCRFWEPTLSKLISRRLLSVL